MQMIEVHYMVVDIFCANHQVANQLRIARDFDIQRIFDSTYRCYAMHQRAYTADTLCKRPCFARITISQNDLYSAHHRSGRGCTNNAAFSIGFRLNTQMPFDAGNRSTMTRLFSGWFIVYFPFALSIFYQVAFAATLFLFIRLCQVTAV